MTKSKLAPEIAAKMARWLSVMIDIHATQALDAGIVARTLPAVVQCLKEGWA